MLQPDIFILARRSARKDGLTAGFFQEPARVKFLQIFLERIYYDGVLSALEPARGVFEAVAPLLVIGLLASEPAPRPPMKLQMTRAKLRLVEPNQSGKIRNQTTW